MHARELLRERISHDPDLEFIGECASGRETIDTIDNLKPDVLFLDIHMPDGSGMDVLKHLADRPLPAVIMVTAYDQYAVQAFEFYALDYLLKPFHRTRFEKAVQRAKDEIWFSGSGKQRPALKDLLQYLEQLSLPLRSEAALATRQLYLQRIIVASSGALVSVPVLDILWIEAEDHYVRLHAIDQSHLTQAKISDLELRLDPRHFQRIHRSTIVRLNAIKHVASAPYGSLTVSMSDNTKLRVSRSFRNKLRCALLNII